MKYYHNMLETIGNTPLVRLSNFWQGNSLLLAKVEYFNPGASVKDRIGVSMIEAAEREGVLQPGQIIVEPTSGNTGIGLAIAATLKGYKLICTAADKISKEKVAMLEALGAKVILCPTDVPPDDERSYYKVAEKIRDEEGAFLPYQYFNPANPQTHYSTTAREIWEETDGKVTHFVAGMGTGGTISGCGKFFKEQDSSIKIVGVDPKGSVYSYYHKFRKMPPPEQIHQYLVDGIGEDMIPSTVWWEYIDEVVTVEDQDAFETVYEVARKEALFCGPSSGAALYVARKVAREAPDNSVVVVILPDSGERYLSKLNKEWMQSHGIDISFLEEDK